MNKTGIILLLLCDLILNGLALTFEIIIIEKIPRNKYFKGDLDTNLKIAKMENKAINVLSCLMITLLSFSLLIKYISICKNAKKNTISNFGYIELICGIKNFFCLILSIAVTFQAKKAKKKYDNDSYDSIKKESEKLIIIEIFAIIFYIGDMFLYFYIVSKLFSFSEKSNDHIIGEPDRTKKYHEIKQYINNDIYEAIIKGIFDKRAEEHLNQILMFYKYQKFDGLYDDDNIVKEILNIILFIVAVLHYQDDKLMINLSKDIEKNFLILFEYSLPLILSVIKLKIEKGYYKKSYITIGEAKTDFFIIMEKEIERNDKEDKLNYKSVFRCKKVTSETIQVLRKSLE